ncbi:MAG: GNAT family N-acetyltransferase [Methylococcaceae bacterium]|nr:GNAT family N-acetyltransferase [Methylococcaceae bacterium]
MNCLEASSPPPIRELGTARLTLRQWQASDLEPFARMNADPQVMKFFPALLSRTESDAMADRMRALITERGFGFWAVELEESQAFIGFVGLHIPAAKLPFSPCVEIGWRLALPPWGQGYATEAAQEALRFAFAHLELPEIVSFTALGNLRSQAVMRRLNMRPQPETFQHPEIPAGHPLREHCWYRLRREEWQS